ncbi:glutaminyl-peptide cyclotransferase [Aerococcaceae bacterium zg-ZJ1578]|uniref:glutaminyl-peptide cyclotransferase n=1 Tax=Aerococcaceae bacterium zg-252 TaxID=2796928 RepID=UPI001A2E4CAB|nr:glutaminyl-peptide cyclotransferase [Aerococcaceae bacterium zg-1578]
MKQWKRMMTFFWSIFGLISSPISVFAIGEAILVERLPSDESAFVQGFELLDDGTLLISTGLYGQSRIQTLSPKNGKVKVQAKLDSDLFGEGITSTDTAIWQLTWKEGVAFKRDKKNLSHFTPYYFDGEGWGLAYDSNEKVLWHSDGTSHLMKRSADNFELLDTITVKDGFLELGNINELEFANDAIYANIWHTNVIVKIDTQTGEVVKKWDLTSLVQTLKFEEENVNRVLNGIAHIEDNLFYVTGKLYPEIWKVNLQ